VGLAERVAAIWSIDLAAGGAWQPFWPTTVPGDCDGDGTADSGYELACRKGTAWYSPLGRKACDTVGGMVVCEAQLPPETVLVRERRVPGASDFGLLPDGHVVVAAGRWVHVLEAGADGLREVGRFRAAGLVRDLAVLGRRVLLATRRGVEVVDVGDPLVPVQERLIRLSPAPRGIAVWGRQAAVATRNGLTMVDPIGGTVLSTVAFHDSGDRVEADPDERGGCFAGWGRRMPVGISGSTAFVARGAQVLAIQLRSTGAPELWARTTVGARIAALRASGRFVYLVLGPPGKQRLVLDATRPDVALPVAGEHDVEEWVFGATWQDGRAYRLVRHRRIEVAELR
jgi:hypothetical protein